MRRRSKAIKKGIATSALAVMMGLVVGGSMCGTLPNVYAEGATVTKPQYYTDFATYEELENAGSEVAISIASEGAILLKNNNKALPLAATENRVSVFGSYSTKIRQAGGGAGGGSSARSKTLQDSMAAAGFTVNPFLTGYYTSTNATNEIGTAALDAYEASYGLYGGAGIVVISRSGSEMRDIAINYDKAKGTHSMMLNKEELELVEYVKDRFNKVIIVLNTPSAMEITNLHYDDEVDSILWIGLTGAEGIMALGKILNGEVNPSGRTVDLYMNKFDTDPTWFNVANNAQTTGETLVRNKNGEVYKIPNVTGGFGGAGPNYASIDYEEGIYMGYRFYETAGADGLTALATTNVATGGATAVNVYGKAPVTALDEYMPADETDAYYNKYNGVLYPYGYGLSYTDFAWTVKTTGSAIAAADKNKEMTVQVTVKNTGSVAGKDVVQLYAEPQYYAGGIEKASKNLVTFAKTKLLKPEEEQTIELKFTPFELASFDDVDANGNGFAGYELEAGTVKLYVSHDSHETEGAAIEYTVAQNDSAEGATKAATAGKTGITWTHDPVSGHEIEAVFSRDEEFKTGTTLNNQYSNTRRGENVMADGGTPLEFMSRNDFTGTFPTAPTAKDVMFSDEAIEFLNQQQAYFSYMDKTTDPWYKSEVPTGWTQKATRGENDAEAIQLYDMAGLSVDDPKWVEFMNQLTWDEIKGLVSAMGFNTAEIKAIGKPKATDSDGPAQLGQNSTNTYWPAACVIGATYNTELAELHGIIVGNESLFTNRQGWYAPSMNIHRSPFSGRNFEYYGQDGVHSGLMAASVIKGVKSKGVVPYIKHFALNDQEQNRQINGGVITWASEQAMREIYLRPYEYCVKKADANAAMASFNRIGIMPSVNDYAFITELTIDEWGMDGYAITDMYAGGSTYWPGNIMVRTGSGPLGSYSNYRTIEGVWKDGKVFVPKTWTKTETPNSRNPEVMDTNYTASEELVESATQWYAVRTMAQRVLYVAANSNLMANGNRAPLEKFFAEGTQTAQSGGFGSTARPEIRKDITGLTAGTAASDLGIGLTEDQQAKLATGATLSYSVVNGALPAGLRLNASTGAITGTPTTAGEYNVTFRATVDRYLTVDKLVKFVVAEDGTVTPPDPEDPNAALNNKVTELTGKIEELTEKISELEKKDNTPNATVESDSTDGVGVAALVLSCISVAAIAGLAVYTLVFARKKN